MENEPFVDKFGNDENSLCTNKFIFWQYNSMSMKLSKKCKRKNINIYLILFSRTKRRNSKSMHIIIKVFIKFYVDKFTQYFNSK